MLLRNMLSYSSSIATYYKSIFINNIAEADCNSQGSHWSFFCRENHLAKINYTHFQIDLDSQKMINVHHNNICIKYLFK